MRDTAAILVAERIARFHDEARRRRAAPARPGLHARLASVGRRDRRATSFVLHPDRS